jgi:ornithine carbamoyltransferase
MKSLISLLDLSHESLEYALRLAAALKRDRPRGRSAPTTRALEGRHVALLFDKPSLRTRATFEIAVHELGGEVIVPAGDVALGARESVADVARNLERWVAAAVVRTFAQQRLVELAQAAPNLAVINALTDEEHPCQAVADYMTLGEHWGGLAGRTLAYVGDGNNVATSLVQAGLMLGVNVNVATPPGYELPESVVEAARGVARHGAVVTTGHDAAAAVEHAHAVYTDVWASMGQEADAARRDADFAAFQVNESLMAAAGAGALFMHCLPAHRGDEVTDAVIDGPTSVVFDQAENRLHTQKALLLMLLAPEHGAC